MLKGSIILMILLTIVSYRLENSYYYKISSIKDSYHYTVKYDINLFEGQVLNRNDFIAVTQIRGLYFKAQIVSMPFEKDFNLLTVLFLLLTLITGSVYWLKKH